MKMIETNEVDRQTFYELIEELNLNAYKRQDEILEYVIETRTDLWVHQVGKVYGDIQDIWDYFNEENDPSGFRHNKVVRITTDWAINTYIDFIYQNKDFTEEQMIEGIGNRLVWYFQDISLGDLRGAYKQAHITEIRNQLIEALLD